MKCLYLFFSAFYLDAGNGLGKEVICVDSLGLINLEEEENPLAEKRERVLEESWNQFDIKIGTLLQFQELSDEYLMSFQKKAKRAIRQHLMKYSRVKSENRIAYESISEKIACICEKARISLAWNKDDFDWNADDFIELARAKDDPAQNEDDRVFHQLSMLLFQEKWLTNIARLLPEDENVLPILPYLITCYIITAPQNRLDPFDSDLKTAPEGWTDIFRELKKDDNSTAKNLTSSINSICRYFYLPIRGRNEAFFYEESDVNRVEKGKRRGRPSLSNSSLSKETLRKHRVLCWEYYRCFLALCKVCDEAGVENLNIALSMALFASIWDWKNIDQYNPTLNIRIRQYTESEIETERVIPKDLEDGDKECPEISLRDYIMDFTSENNSPKDFVLYYLRQMRTKKKKRDFDLDKEFDDFGMFFDG